MVFEDCQKLSVCAQDRLNFLHRSTFDDLWLKSCFLAQLPRKGIGIESRTV